MTRANFTLIAASVLSLAAAGCSKQADPAVGASNASSDAMGYDDTMSSGGASESAMPEQLAAGSHGALFLTDAMKGDNSEVKLGQLAADQGGSEAVRSFGKTLVTDHGKHSVQLASLAASMGVAKTDAIMPEADAAYAELKALKGDAFDAAFKKHMVMDHEKDIARYQAEAASKDPAAITAIAGQTVPTLKKHLAMAHGL